MSYESKDGRERENDLLKECVALAPPVLVSKLLDIPDDKSNSFSDRPSIEVEAEEVDMLQETINNIDDGIKRRNAIRDSKDGFSETAAGEVGKEKTDRGVSTQGK